MESSSITELCSPNEHASLDISSLEFSTSWIISDDFWLKRVPSKITLGDTWWFVNSILLKSVSKTLRLSSEIERDCELNCNYSVDCASFVFCNFCLALVMMLIGIMNVLLWILFLWLIVWSPARQ